MYLKQYYGNNDKKKLVQFLKIFNFNLNYKIMNNIYKEKKHLC